MTKAGFTLIELLVVVAIMMLIVGGGVVTYLGFNDKEIVLTNGEQVQSLMRTAQKRARVGDKPTGCGHLLGYSIVVKVANLSQVLMQAVCDNNTYTTISNTLPVGVTFQNPVNMTFGVLGSGVTGAGNVSIRSSTSKWTFTFTVDPGGEITDGTMTQT